ncbi:M28 family metallopeptidase, partial [candidate division KSB1 bacterium]
DEMMGRDPYSDSILMAEDYIARQFKNAGLSEFPEFKNYRQSFQMFLTEQDRTNSGIKINGVAYPGAVFAASGNVNYADLSQSDIENTFDITNVGASDNLRNSLSRIIRNYENNWIWVDPAHEDALSNYRRFLDRSVPSAQDPRNNKRTLIIAVRPEEKIERIDIDIRVNTREITLTNIIGYLEGSDPELNDEFFIFSGHHDHIGFNEEIEGDDKIYNGADDNATGVTGVITLAEYFSRHREFKRSIIFVTFTAEEKGLLGARQLLEDLPVPRDKIVGMINFEMLGKQSKWGWNRTFLTGFEYSNLGEIMKAAISDTSKFNIYPDPYGLFYGSDNAPFARADMVSHSLSSTDVGGDKHYHQVTDEYETLSIDNMVTVIRGVSEAVMPVLNGAKTPARIK